MKKFNPSSRAMIAWIFLCLLSISCNKINFEDTVCKEKNIAFEQILKTDYCIWNQRKSNLVIQDDRAWDPIQVNQDARINCICPLPEIDFKSYTVIAVFQGQQSSGGYTTVIEKVVSACNDIKVYVKETVPGDNCMVTDVITSPCHIIKLPKTTKNIQFITSKEITKCK